MKTMRVGSSSSCPSKHASRAAFTVLRRCSAACAVFFARDLATLEEPPERADSDGDAPFPQPLPQFRQRNVALGGQGCKDQFVVGIIPVRMAVTARELGPNLPLELFLTPQADRARRAHAEPFSSR